MCLLCHSVFHQSAQTSSFHSCPECAIGLLLHGPNGCQYLGILWNIFTVDWLPNLVLGELFMFCGHCLHPPFFVLGSHCILELHHLELLCVVIVVPCSYST